jgi:hypothetical protein
VIPFRTVRELVVSTANLVEAEGRALKGSVVRVAAAAAGFLVSAILALGALGMLAAALYTGLVQGAELAPALAWLITGLVYLMAAGGVAWLMTRVAKG